MTTNTRHARPARLRLLACALVLAVLMTGVAAAAAPQDGTSSWAGRTVLVTGSTDGLGREVALALAARGAHVIVHGRNRERGEAVVARIAADGRGSADFIAADFASLAAVHAFADQLLARAPRLDLLVNNAGIALPGDAGRQTSADGHELQFAVNYLAGWVLVHRLRPALAAAAPSRVLNVASGSAHPIDFDDVMLARPGAHRRGYGQSKLAQITMTAALAPGFAADGITLVALHPATRMDTTMVRALGATPEASIAEGRDHVLALAEAATLEAGRYYRHGAPATPHDQAGDRAAQQRLLALSASLTGVGGN